MGSSCCKKYMGNNDDIDYCDNIKDIRNFLSTVINNADVEQEEINLYLQDKNNIPTIVEVEGFTEEDLKKRILYLDEMKNCLNEVDELLKNHPNVNLVDIKHSIKEFQNMYSWIFDDSKRYKKWLEVFKNFIENN